MEAIQIAYGNQPRPYANHHWEWVIKKDGTPKEEVLEWARKNLKYAPYDIKEYKMLYAQKQSFENLMKLVCGGFYELKETPTEWRYVIEMEYID